MAKKKKKVENKSNVAVIGAQKISYQGKILVKLMHGNTIISNKEYHNSGMPNLFKFLAYSVASDNDGTDLRPVKIKLFKYPGADVPLNDGGQLPNNFSWTRAWGTTTNGNEKNQLAPVQVSPFVHYDIRPVIKEIANAGTTSDNRTADDYHYETTLHFNIPFSYISGDTIHMVGLYPLIATNQNSEISAYYLFTKNDGKEWDPIVLGDETGNYSIIIEWTMIFTNKTIDTTQQN